ncbi:MULTISPECIES: LAGLIDADG family homing endonuclease [unclassified Planococcus (in: firmicutes)]|uniref:LAGLIDADG family homing endonuclease n=1 Tax=unclassified Planococcus (in: firmicutes) TaxID=2662419 RepID=UPI000C7B87BA|nr:MULTISPECIES: LAGLIDADG family homing endonuclease [unclassified Planococcus (in: firmicutes)]PKG44453.1 hypothetical protein CXF66_17065 [Planococcus sp. Urea-trap-24]PKG91269.1 hypothetical protein CXF91_02770 [Planococcus sp. Urea-3u-39]PKH37067.1 hypothetical protein CXF77_12715 [Planococcus sp. MB-3u-09]
MVRKVGITDQMILNKYTEGFSNAELAAYAGLTERAIRNVLYKSGIDSIQRPRKHKVNEDFFKTWTDDMAWVLGLVITDGCIANDGRTLILIQKDEFMLQKVAVIMQADFVVARHEKRTPALLINSKKITNDLANYGVLKSKSISVGFPNVPEKYMPHFIRGVVDGDGWVQKTGYTMNVTSGSKDFANGLHDVFRKWNLNSSIRISKTPLGRVLYRVFVSGKHDIPRLADIIYKDCGEMYVFQKRERMSQRCFKIPEPM